MCAGVTQTVQECAVQLVLCGNVVMHKVYCRTCNVKPRVGKGGHFGTLREEDYSEREKTAVK